MAQTQDTVLLRDAVAAAKAGNKAQARQLLRQASVHNPNSELVWLWRASLSESPKEATFYLGEVLRVNPNNQKAAAWLARCKGQGTLVADGGAARPASSVVVPPPVSSPSGGAAREMSGTREMSTPRETASARPGVMKAPEGMGANSRPVAPLRTQGPPPQAHRTAPPAENLRPPEPAARPTPNVAPPPAASPFPATRTPVPVPSVRTPFPRPVSQPIAAGPVTPPQAEWPAPGTVLSPLPGLRAEQPAKAAAPTPAPPAPKWACPFCAYSSETSHRRCPTCKAITVLEDLREVEKNDGVTEKTVREALGRYEATPSDQRTFEHNVYLALGHLNLREATKAMPYLKLATSQRRNDWALLGVLDQIQWRKVILVVDDSLTIRKALSNFLEKNEFRVVMAEDGKKALEKLNEVVPDLVLLDITMPNIDGYQVCRTMKDNALTKAVPVVMLSGKDGIFDKVRGKLAGCSDYVTKPFDPEALLKTIRKYVKA
ncbi:MAG: response regulator [Bryobacteraceae bacterium]|nr:response regulator [Bryobacteraceae bacterium]